MARTYKEEAPADLVYWAVGLLLMGLWCVRDGWFPSKEVLEKHPLEVAMSFPRDGNIAKILVRPGQEVVEKVEGQAGSGTKLAELDIDALRQQFAEADVLVASTERDYREAGSALAAAQETKNTERIASLAKVVEERKALYDRAFSKRETARKDLDTCTLHSSRRGVVKSIPVKEKDPVKAGDPVVIVDPQETFYPFNKSLAMMCLLASAFCAFRHWRNRR